MVDYRERSYRENLTFTKIRALSKSGARSLHYSTDVIRIVEQYDRIYKITLATSARPHTLLRVRSQRQRADTLREVLQGLGNAHEALGHDLDIVRLRTDVSLASDAADYDAP